MQKEAGHDVKAILHRVYLSFHRFQPAGIARQRNFLRGIPMRFLNPIILGFVTATGLTFTAVGAAIADPPAHEQGTTKSVQGDQSAWVNNPHMHDFYNAAVAAFANGPSKVDVPAFEAKSHAIFDAFAVSMGMDPKAMQEHLALIPKQVVQIAKEDPKVLNSYDSFIVALMGPQ
jgi:hypothetical protein